MSTCGHAASSSFEKMPGNSSRRHVAVKSSRFEAPPGSGGGRSTPKSCCASEAAPFADFGASCGLRKSQNEAEQSAEREAKAAEAAQQYRIPSGS